MTLDNASCYRALTARDPRFDGVFFVGVTSTGIYCRPVCRARTPRRANCRFFANAAAAERTGFRPCLRCRPELAPGRSQVESTTVLAENAARRIAAGALNGASVDDLAGELAVTSRHLRRSVQQHLGVSPIELATTHRLLLAKRLLHDTTLPVAQVAFASGFESPRRFNDAFKRRYRLAPGALRRQARSGHTYEAPAANATGDARRASPSHDEREAVKLALEYRRPLDWDALLAFLAARATPGVEHVAGGSYSRSIFLGGHAGEFTVAPSERRKSERHTLTATVSPSLLPVLMPLLARLRDLFDLDANPEVIAAQLTGAGVPGDAATVAGIRIPGSVDGFELTVRAILGQQVSVRGATTLMGRFVRTFGEPYGGANPAITFLAPTATRVARATARELASLGLPASRAAAVRRLAESVAAGDISLAPGADAKRAMGQLVALPGIGDWTANYVAMRALRWPDAFPAGDLALRKAAGGITPGALVKLAERWRPWRAYAAMALWRSLSPARPPLSAKPEKAARDRARR